MPFAGLRMGNITGGNDLMAFDVCLVCLACVKGSSTPCSLSPAPWSSPIFKHTGPTIHFARELIHFVLTGSRPFGGDNPTLYSPACDIRTLLLSGKNSTVHAVRDGHMGITLLGSYSL